MYNIQLKEQFIKEYTTSASTREACVGAFNKLEKHEVEWGADFCTMSVDEIREAVEELVGMRSRSKVGRISMLREYSKWCLQHNVPGATDSMLNLKIDGLDKIKQQMVTCPLHLQVYLDQICEPESEQTTDNIYRCFYWLAYAGLSEEDSLRITADDVDLASMVVRYNNTYYPLYREAIPAFKNCMTLTQFVYRHPNYSYDKTIWKDRAEGNTLVRGIKAPPSPQAIRVELSRRSRRCVQAKKTTLKLSHYRVWLSGLFYRMYEREMAGIDVDFYPAAGCFMQGKTYNLKSNRMSMQAYQRKVAKDYQRDYELWKMIFA